MPPGQPARMGTKAAITVNRPREEVERLWRAWEHSVGAAATFADAPGDRGTEIHLRLDESGPLVKLLRGQPALARAKDDLRRFKQQVETGEVARSEELEEAGVR